MGEAWKLIFKTKEQCTHTLGVVDDSASSLKCYIVKDMGTQVSTGEARSDHPTAQGDGAGATLSRTILMTWIASWSSR